ncbi:MAG: autotransporter outer membrane beta-barrel domain-containing protein [Sutterellaceae bacterium]|nr:autotransporter outer membrane beta-barrel domain-containing protein [Sutterellaceae bacterium]
MKIKYPNPDRPFIGKGFSTTKNFSPRHNLVSSLVCLSVCSFTSGVVSAENDPVNLCAGDRCVSSYNVLTDLAEISGGNVAAGHIEVTGGFSDLTANGNTVTLDSFDDSALKHVFGARISNKRTPDSNTAHTYATANGNTVRISSMEFTSGNGGDSNGAVYGAFNWVSENGISVVDVPYEVITRAIGNKVYIEDSSIAGNVYGAMSYASILRIEPGATKALSHAFADDNHLSLTGTALENKTQGMLIGGKSWLYTAKDHGSGDDIVTGFATAKGNTVSVSGYQVEGYPSHNGSGSLVPGTVIGGWARLNINDGSVRYPSVTANADNNQVEVKDGTSVAGDVKGGTAEVGYRNEYLSPNEKANGKVYVTEALATASGNQVWVIGDSQASDQTKVVGSVYGGHVITSSAQKIYATLQENIVTIDGASVGGSIYGAVFGLPESETENIVLTEATLNLSGNTVLIQNEATIDGNVYGAYVQTQFDSAKIAETQNVQVTDNTVLVRGNIHLDNAELYGSNLSVDHGNQSGNQLEMTGYSGSMKNITNFNGVSLDLNGLALKENEAVVTLTEGQTDLSATAVNIFTSSTDRIVTATGDLAQRYELIANTDTGLSADESTFVNRTLTVAKSYSVDAVYNIVYDNENSIDAVSSHNKARQGTDIFTEGRLAVSGLLTSGADFALDRKLDCSINKDGTIPERCVYVDMQAEKLRYKTKNDARLRTTGSHLVLGLKGKLNDREDIDKDINGAVYFEAGRANLRATNDWAKGEGDSEYYGLGLIGEYRQHEGSMKGSYIQLHGRIGQVSNDLNAAFIGAGDGSAGYDETSTYWGYGVEIGYRWVTSESTRLDLAARYRSLTVEGFDSTIAGDRYEIDDVESRRTHLGARFNYVGHKNVVPYVGLAWEYEFGAKANGHVAGLALAEDSLKGSTGVGEIGVKVSPSEGSPWTIDGSLKGYFGRTEGVAASLYVSYLF